MTLADALLETLTDFAVENSLPIPDDALGELAQNLTTVVECYHEVRSYGQPGGMDMVAMHVRAAVAPLERRIMQEDDSHARLITEMTDNRDYWRNQYYRVVYKERT